MKTEMKTKLSGNKAFSRACCNRDLQAEKGPFIRNWSDRIKGNGFELREERFRGNIGKKFFHVRVERD